MKYTIKVEIRIDLPDDLVLDAWSKTYFDTREKRQSVVSSDFKEFLDDTMADECFTFFDVQVTTVESDG